MLEVVKSVKEGSKVSFKGPTGSSWFSECDKIVERVSFYEFSDVDWVVVVNQGGHYLEETDQIGHFGTHLHFLVTLVVSFIFLDERGNVFGSWNHDIGIAVVLHNLQDLNLMGPQASTIAIN